MRNGPPPAGHRHRRGTRAPNPACLQARWPCSHMRVRDTEPSQCEATCLQCRRFRAPRGALRARRRRLRASVAAPRRLCVQARAAWQGQSIAGAARKLLGREEMGTLHAIALRTGWPALSAPGR